MSAMKEYHAHAANWTVRAIFTINSSARRDDSGSGRTESLSWPPLYKFHAEVAGAVASPIS